MLSEVNIIQKLQESFYALPDGVQGIGDDAAIIPLNETQSYVITKDLLVENTHFRLRYFDPFSLAHKAIHVNLSDCAAMGAKPLFILLGLSIPHYIETFWLDSFLKHFSEICHLNKIALIGGDTTRSENDFFISITVLGRANNTDIKFRHSAKVDDVICFVGNIGEAQAGLIALEKNIPGLASLKKSALHPQALIQEGIWLGQQKAVTAMMDISDGLYVDLQKLCQSSKVGAEISLENLTPTNILREGAQTLHLDYLECMLTGGEDYALLLTISPLQYPGLFHAFTTQFGYSLIPIGKITQGSDVSLTRNSVKIPFSYSVFSHFGETHG